MIINNTTSFSNIYKDTANCATRAFLYRGDGTTSNHQLKIEYLTPYNRTKSNFTTTFVLILSSAGGIGLIHTKTNYQFAIIKADNSNTFQITTVFVNSTELYWSGSSAEAVLNTKNASYWGISFSYLNTK